MATQTPLVDLHKSMGATFVERSGWLLPDQFEGLPTEYKAVRTGVGLLDLANRAFLAFTGPDRLSYLQGMLSNDVRPLTPGQGLYATVLNVQGKVVGDCRVFCTEDAFVLDLWEPIKNRVVEHLNRYLVADEVEISDGGEKDVIVSLQGPLAEALMEKLIGQNELPRRPLDHAMARLDGIEVRVARFSHTGEKGFDLFIPLAELNRLAQRLTDEGQIFGAKWIGEQAREVLRIEAGIPLYGVDFAEDHLLLETGMDHAVSFFKGCYLGQEVVERIRSRGHVNKKLSGLLLSGREPARHGDRICAAEKEIGRITSSVYSPTVDRAIGLGYLQKDFWSPGTTLNIDREGASLEARVTTLPFLERKDELRSSS
jgi:aminomethyltransferase